MDFAGYLDENIETREFALKINEILNKRVKNILEKQKWIEAKF